MKKIVSVLYFAMLKEQRMLAQEELETTATTPRELYCELTKTYNFNVPLSVIRVAVNEEFASMEHLLREHDEIAFIPPVTGG